jgi:isopenicillin N synthase-like dioxygenase
MSFTSFSGNQRVLLSDTSRKADFSEIPIISLAAPKTEVISQLRDAATRVGFFYIKDHGVPQTAIDAIFGVGKDFFALSSQEKNQTNFRNNRLLRGYEPPREVTTDATRKPDLNEAFNWGYEADLDPLKSELTSEQRKSPSWLSNRASKVLTLDSMELR